MDNIFIYEGHSSQTLFDLDSPNITSGLELFNRTRVPVPEGFRIVTFHFNGVCTSANYSGPFILHGMKDITPEDINLLFVINNEERKRNINLFQKKIVSSFIYHYSTFINSDDFVNSETFGFANYSYHNINSLEDIIILTIQSGFYNYHEWISNKMNINMSDHNIQSRLMNKIKSMICNTSNKLKDHYKKFLYIDRILGQNLTIEIFCKIILLSLSSDDIEYIDTGIERSRPRSPWGPGSIAESDIKQLKFEKIYSLPDDLITRTLSHVKLTVRVYSPGILTPMLNFYDQLYFSKSNIMLTPFSLQEKGTVIYRHGFFPLAEYKKLSELEFKRTTDTHNLERNIENGLSPFSFEHKIPEKLSLTLKYYLESQTYADIIYYIYNSILSDVFNFQTTYYNIKNFNHDDILFSDVKIKFLSMIIRQDIIDNLVDMLNHLDKNGIGFGVYTNPIDNPYKYLDDILICIKSLDISLNEKNILLIVHCIHACCILINNHKGELSLSPNLVKNVSQCIYDVSKFIMNIYNNIFTIFDNGTFFITSCGSFSEKLERIHDSLSAIEKENFKNISAEYDECWTLTDYKQKYLKYKQKYISLKNKIRKSN